MQRLWLQEQDRTAAAGMNPPPPLTQNGEGLNLEEMIRVTAIALVVLQSFLFAGPLCASHSTAAESMDCCKNGHMEVAPAAFQDPNTDSCCAKCDMGKSKSLSFNSTPAIRPASLFFPHPLALIGLVNIPEQHITTGLLEKRWNHQKFSSTGPPKLFLLNQSFLL